MTALLSDLKPQSGNWVELQPGTLNCRQPAQKCILAAEPKASCEKENNQTQTNRPQTTNPNDLVLLNNTLVLSSTVSKLLALLRQPSNF